MYLSKNIDGSAGVAQVWVKISDAQGNVLKEKCVAQTGAVKGKGKLYVDSRIKDWVLSDVDNSFTGTVSTVGKETIKFSTDEFEDDISYSDRDYSETVITIYMKYRIIGEANRPTFVRDTETEKKSIALSKCGVYGGKPINSIKKEDVYYVFSTNDGLETVWFEDTLRTDGVFNVSRGFSFQDEKYYKTDADYNKNVGWTFSYSNIKKNTLHYLQYKVSSANCEERTYNTTFVVMNDPVFEKGSLSQYDDTYKCKNSLSVNGDGVVYKGLGDFNVKDFGLIYGWEAKKGNDWVELSKLDGLDIDSLGQSFNNVDFTKYKGDSIVLRQTAVFTSFGSRKIVSDPATIYFYDNVTSDNISFTNEFNYKLCEGDAIENCSKKEYAKAINLDGLNLKQTPTFTYEKLEVDSTNHYYNLCSGEHTEFKSTVGTAKINNYIVAKLNDGCGTAEKLSKVNVYSKQEVQLDDVIIESDDKEASLVVAKDEEFKEYADYRKYNVQIVKDKQFYIQLVEGLYMATIYYNKGVEDLSFRDKLNVTAYKDYQINKISIYRLNELNCKSNNYIDVALSFHGDFVGNNPIADTVYVCPAKSLHDFDINKFYSNTKEDYKYSYYFNKDDKWVGFDGSLTINEATRIKRVASVTVNGVEVNDFGLKTNEVTVLPFATFSAKIALDENGDYKNRLDGCFNDSVYAKITDNVVSKFYNGGFTYRFDGQTNKYYPLNSLNDITYEISNNLLGSGKKNFYIEMCEGKVKSNLLTVSFSDTIKADIRKDLILDLDCRYAGDELVIKKNNEKDDFEYNFWNGRTLEGDRSMTLTANTNKIIVDKRKVISGRFCSVFDTIEVKVLKNINPSKLVVSNDMNKMHSPYVYSPHNSKEWIMVCAESDLQLFPSDKGDGYTYLYRVPSLYGEEWKDYSKDTLVFPKTGTDYKLERLALADTACMNGKIEEFYFRTYAGLSVSDLVFKVEDAKKEINKNANNQTIFRGFCENENTVEITVDADISGGTGKYLYAYASKASDFDNANNWNNWYDKNYSHSPLENELLLTSSYTRYYFRIKDQTCRTYEYKSMMGNQGGVSEVDKVVFDRLHGTNNWSRLAFTDSKGKVADLNNLTDKTSEGWYLKVTDGYNADGNDLDLFATTSGEQYTRDCSKEGTKSSEVIITDESQNKLHIVRSICIDGIDKVCNTVLDTLISCDNGWNNSGTFTIYTGDGENPQTEYIGCADGSSLEIKTDAGMLSYNTGGESVSFNALPKADVGYAWQIKRSKYGKWENVKGNATANSETLKVTVDESTAYYRCVISYKSSKVASANEVKVLSNASFADGKNRDALVDSSGKSNSRICYNSDGVLRLRYTEYPINATDGKSNIEYVWQWSNKSGSDWKDIKKDADNEDVYYSEVRANEVDVKYKGVVETTYFRCGVKFNCAEDTSWSYNYIMYINDDVNKYPIAGNVHLADGSNSMIIETGNAVSELPFVIYNQVDANHSGYSFYAPNTKDSVALVEGSAFLTVNSRNKWKPSGKFDKQEYFLVGKHNVLVSKTKDGCSSKVDTFSYTLYENMIAMLARPERKIESCIDDTIGTVSVNIKGGDKDSLPVVNWYILSPDNKEVVSLNSPLAKFYVTNGETHTDAYFSDEFDYSSRVMHLVPKKSFKLFATVERGNYPKVLTTDTLEVSVPEAVKAGEIALAKSGKFCYGTTPAIIEKTEATGGSGDYAYDWYMNGTDVNSTEKEFTSPDVITEPVTFQRTVMDMVAYRCTSDVARDNYIAISNTVAITEGNLTKPFPFDANDYISGNRTVSVGSPITFSVNTSVDVNHRNYCFVIEDANGVSDENSVIDTISSAEVAPYGRYNSRCSTEPTSEGGMYKFSVRQYDTYGCPSHNADTIEICVVNGGRIAFADAKISPSSAKIGGVYWMCPNENVGTICGSGETANGIKTFYDNNTENFLWKYIKDGYGYTLKDNNGNNVKSTSVNLDTTDIDLSNLTVKEKVVKIYRTDNAKNQSNFTVKSDTLELHIAPNITKAYDLIKVGVDTRSVCADNSGVVFTATLDSAMVDGQSFGAVGYYSDDRIGEFYKYYWQMNSGRHDEEEDWSVVSDEYSDFTTESRYFTDALEKKTFARFVVEDGCASIYNEASATVMSADSAKGFKITTNGVLSDYIEVGDKVQIRYADANTEVKWYSAEVCDSCEMETDGIAIATKIDSITFDDNVYVSVLMKSMGVVCESKRFRVPLTVYPVSEGGTIHTNITKVCMNGDLPLINSYAPATGGDGDFVYEWQYSADSTNYNTIEGASLIYLDSESLNELAGTMKTIYLRRKATNRGGRSVYSNVVRLEKYEEFVMFVSVI